MENIILKEYNLNIININYILNNKIELEISNFIYLNNLDLSIKSIDTKKIILHFIIQEILVYSKLEYNNIILHKNDYRTEHINFLGESETCTLLITKLLKLVSKNLDVPLILLNSDQLIDKDFILRMKTIAENKSKNNMQNIVKFMQRNELRKLVSDIKDPTIKLKLHKI